MTDAERSMIAALELVLFGLTHPENKCWPTTRGWTKKERDKQMLTAVRGALAFARTDLSERGKEHTQRAVAGWAGMPEWPR